LTLERGTDPDEPDQPVPTQQVIDPAEGQAIEPAWGRRAGVSTFTIEGRSAPGLFVVGWLATLSGLGLVLIGLLASDGIARLGLIVLGLLVLSVGLVAAAGSQGIERRAHAVPGYAGPSPLLVFAASIPVSILAVIAIGVPLGAIGVDLAGPVGALLSVAVQAVVYVALVRLLVVDTGALDWRSMGILHLDRLQLVELVGGAFWALPVIVATIPVSLILLAIFPVTPESPLPPTGEAVGFALSMVAGAIVAPAGEELLFRGFATTAWVRRLGPRQGILRAALIFAFAHVLTTSGTSTGDAVGLAVVGFGTRIPIGLALGWLFVRRGTIWAPLGLHGAFNAILLVIGEVGSRSI
jgi:membrane protease YdiL (CAAX protease family)